MGRIHNFTSQNEYGIIAIFNWPNYKCNVIHSCNSFINLKAKFYTVHKRNTRWKRLEFSGNFGQYVYNQFIGIEEQLAATEKIHTAGIKYELSFYEFKCHIYIKYIENSSLRIGFSLFHHFDWVLRNRLYTSWWGCCYGIYNKIYKMPVHVIAICKSLELNQSEFHIEFSHFIS